MPPYIIPDVGVLVIYKAVRESLNFEIQQCNKSWLIFCWFWNRLGCMVVTTHIRTDDNSDPYARLVTVNEDLSIFSVMIAYMVKRLST